MRRKGPAPTPVGVRFWRYVEKTEGCWLWRASRRSNGYGQFMTGSRSDGSRKIDSADRVSWTLHTGKPIPDGLCVLHRCDNPPCVRPEHLFLGTKADNSIDMRNKGRSGGHSPGDVAGELNPNAALKTNDVLDIRNAFRLGVSQKSLAQMFGVSNFAIWAIVSRRTWRHLT